VAAGKPKSGATSRSPKGARPALRPAAIAPAANAMQGMTTPQKVAWIALHVLVFAVPLAMSNANWLAQAPFNITAFQLPLTYDQFDIIKVFVMRACALVGIGAWGFEFFLSGGKLRRTKADWLIVGFLGWLLVTSFTSISVATAFFGKYRRFEGFWSFLTYAVVFFLVVQLADRAVRIRSLAHTLVVSGGLVSFYGFLQYFAKDPISWGTTLPFEFQRAFATFGNPDLLGGYLIFPLVLSLAMALSDKRTLWRAVYWGVFLITAFCWGASFVRGAWIGGGVALIVLAIGAIIARVPWGVVDWSATGITTLAGSAFVARSLSSTNDVMNIWTRLQSIFLFDQGSAKTRFEIWSAAIRAVKERPLFGFGADTFRLVFPHTKPLEYVRDAGYLSVADNVHNYPLQLAAGIGIVGFALLYGLFGWVLYLGVPNAFAKGKGPERLIITGFWAAALGYIVHLMFGLSVTGSTVFLWLALALILAPTARAVEIAPKKWGQAAGIALVAVVMAASIYNVVYIVADNYYLRAQFPRTGEDTVALNLQAIALNPFNDMYKSQLGQTYNRRMLQWVQQARTDQQGGKDPSVSLAQAKSSFLEAESAFQTAIAFVPAEYDNYVFLTALYNQAGSYFDAKYFEQAVKTGDQGIAAEKYGPAVRFQKALALYNLDRLDEVVSLLEETVKMDPSYTDPMVVLADTYKRQGQIDKARQQYQNVIAIATGTDESSLSTKQQAQAGLDSLATSASTTTQP
jgi:O-antigen ligase/tetratricopeptide (TPR) repeat protein